MTVTIRAARPGDVPEILRLVRALAEYEREPDAVDTTESDLAAALFPETGTATTHALVAVADGPDAGPSDRLIGIAIWFVTFSTWTGRHGIWLEDLFVDPAHRGSGAGRALMARLARIAGERGWRRMEWSVLNWNEPSIGFYHALGSVRQSEWQTHRLAGDALRALAEDHDA